MNLADFQRLAAALGLYRAGIDGLWGPSTKAALDILTQDRPEIRNWSRERIIVAGCQLALTKLGYECGNIDGYAGGLTNEAFNAWQYKKTYGVKEKLDRTPVISSPPSNFPKQSAVGRFYGKPGPAIQSQLVTVSLPYPMVLDWDTSARVTKMTLHKKCADSASAALEGVLKHYGLETIHHLGLDRFAGSYNHRKMRGGNSWSMHAYGCAIDFNAGPNGLRTRCPQALFCGDDYVPFFDIWESYGWTSLGRAINRDWMHVQAASL